MVEGFVKCISKIYLTGFLEYIEIQVYRKTIQVTQHGCAGAALEGQMFSPTWKVEQLPKRPANPEIFFDAGRRKI